MNQIIVNNNNNSKNSITQSKQHSSENPQIKTKEKKRANIESRKSMFESVNQWKTNNSELMNQQINKNSHFQSSIVGTCIFKILNIMTQF